MEFFHFCNGLCYNWQEAITLNSFHIIPFYWVVWSLFSIKDLKEFRNGFFFCPWGLFQPDANTEVLHMIFGLEIICFHIITHQPLHFVLQGVLALCAEMNADDIGGAAILMLNEPARFALGVWTALLFCTMRYLLETEKSDRVCVGNEVRQRASKSLEHCPIWLLYCFYFFL